MRVHEFEWNSQIQSHQDFSILELHFCHFFLPSKNTTNTIIDPIDLFFFIHVFFGEHDSWKHLGLLGSACLPAVGGRKDTMAVML